MRNSGLRDRCTSTYNAYIVARLLGLQKMRGGRPIADNRFALCRRGTDRLGGSSRPVVGLGIGRYKKKKKLNQKQQIELDDCIIHITQYLRI